MSTAGSTASCLFALKRGDLAGAVIVVVKDGQVLTQRGFGYADAAKRTPVDPARTLFRPGSVSKLFTWTAVMQQVEAGRIDLDADVNTYLDFKIPAYQGKPATMRQLMTHTAGFEEHAKLTMFDDPKFQIPLGDLVKGGDSEPHLCAGDDALLFELWHRAGGLYRRARDEDIVRRLCRTAHLPAARHGAVDLPPAAAPGASRRGWRRAIASFRRALRSSRSSVRRPRAAFRRPAPTWAKFMIAHLNQGAGLMKPETARMMHDTPLTILPPLNRMELGFFETNINGRQVIAHLGDTQLFHTALHLFTKRECRHLYVVQRDRRTGLGRPRAPRAVRGFRRSLSAGQRNARDARRCENLGRTCYKCWWATGSTAAAPKTTFYAIASLFGQVKISVGPEGELIVPAARDLNGKPAKWVETSPFVWHNADGHGRARRAGRRTARSCAGASTASRPSWCSTGRRRRSRRRGSCPRCAPVSASC